MTPTWANAKECHRCNISFGIFKYRYHCRNCGLSFCHEHCNNFYKTQRVCNTCLKKLATPPSAPPQPVILHATPINPVPVQQKPLPMPVNQAPVKQEPKPVEQELNPKIKAAKESKKKLEQQAKVSLAKSKQCGKTYDKFMQDIKYSLKINNAAGALIYCTTAVRQKKFEKRYLIHHDRLNALAQKVMDAIMHYEMSQGVTDVNDSLKGIHDLIGAMGNMDDIVNQMETSNGVFKEAEIQMGTLFDDDIFGSTTGDDDKLLAKELFQMISQEHDMGIKETLPTLDTLGINTELKASRKSMVPESKLQPIDINFGSKAYQNRRNHVSSTSSNKSSTSTSNAKSSISPLYDESEDLDELLSQLNSIDKGGNSK